MRAVYLLVVCILTVVAADSEEEYDGRLVITCNSDVYDQQHGTVALPSTDRARSLKLDCYAYDDDNQRDDGRAVMWRFRPAGQGEWKSTRNSHTWTISAPGKADNGDYECYIDDLVRTVHVYINHDGNINTTMLSDLKTAHFTYNARCGQQQLRDDESFQWFHNGNRLGDDVEDMEIENEGADKGKLTRHYITDANAGVYVCQVSGPDGALRRTHISKVFAGVSLKVHSTPGGLSVIEGNDATVECDSYGYPPPNEVHWKREGEPLTVGNLRENVKMSIGEWGLKNARLTLEDANYENRAMYTCEASNKYGTDSKEAMLRVKDKLAALWPFLAILAQVILLILIIFIFERRQKAKLARLEEEERKGLASPGDSRAIKT